MKSPLALVAGESRSLLFSGTDYLTSDNNHTYRVCPGRHVGLSVLWLAAATILSTFNINKAKDETGNTKEPSIQYYSGLIW